MTYYLLVSNSGNPAALAWQVLMLSAYDYLLTALLPLSLGVYV
jgi:hypothetical protein